MFSSVSFVYWFWQALYYTGNYNADLAAAWIFENQDKNLDAPLTEVSFGNIFSKNIWEYLHVMRSFIHCRGIHSYRFSELTLKPSKICNRCNFRETECVCARFRHWSWGTAALMMMLLRSFLASVQRTRWWWLWIRNLEWVWVRRQGKLPTRRLASIACWWKNNSSMQRCWWTGNRWGK